MTEVVLLYHLDMGKYHLDMGLQVSSQVFPHHLLIMGNKKPKKEIMLFFHIFSYQFKGKS